MKIRSVTSFIDPGWPSDTVVLDQVAALSRAAQETLEAAGYEVQTTRLATTPFPELRSKLSQAAAIELAQTLEEAAATRGFGYLSLGPTPTTAPESYALIPAMLKATENAFFGASLTTPDGMLDTNAVQASAHIIHQAAGLEKDGFANLRFAALANVPPGSPFFPAAYHAGGPSRFAFATQAADLAVAAFENAASVEAGSAALTAVIDQHGRQLARVGSELAKKQGVDFGGIDFSLAPFPEEVESLGAAFERMGIAAVGESGSLAAAAILTQAIDHAEYPRAGFNGLLLSLLEDAVLAKRTAEGHLGVGDLLMYSAVCGTGLDTVPLPGDTSPAQLAALLLDVAALALRLNKPLTARLMPIPGKKAGDETGFDFPFFTNSRVMTLNSAGMHGALAATQKIRLTARAHDD